MSALPTPGPGAATQVRRPWRTTVRSAVQTAIALAALVPVLVELKVLPVERAPWLGVLIVGAAALTRLMADPRIEAFLRRFAPWLAADPPRTDG